MFGAVLSYSGPAHFKQEERKVRDKMCGSETEGEILDVK